MRKLNKYRIKSLVKKAIGFGEFTRAIANAGGSVKCFTRHKLEDMSAFELIEILATNNIHFVFRLKKISRTENLKKGTEVICNLERCKYNFDFHCTRGRVAIYADNEKFNDDIIRKKLDLTKRKFPECIDFELI